MNALKGNAGSALILALSIIMLLVSLGTAGIIFARHERIQAADFLTTNNVNHTINIGIEEGISLAHMYSSPRRSLCRINGDNPNDAGCNATTTGNIELPDGTIDYQLDFNPYEYPGDATFIVRAPYPEYTNETTITLDANLNIQRRVTTIH